MSAKNLFLISVVVFGFLVLGYCLVTQSRVAIKSIAGPTAEEVAPAAPAEELQVAPSDEPLGGEEMGTGEDD